MDAAAAAAMSDPERNPLFRRRWGLGTEVCTAERFPPEQREADSLELAGLELLQQWRQDRLQHWGETRDRATPR